jgi:hypothetical protein
MLRLGLLAVVLIGPGKPIDWPWPFVYPITAGIVILPIAWLPMLTARFVFVGLGAGLFAFVLTRESWHRWPALISGSFFVAIQAAQWSPLLVAGLGLPALAVVFAAKPHIGAALVLARSDRRLTTWALASGLVVLAVGLILRPSWPWDWQTSMAMYAGHGSSSLLVRPLGWPLLIALMRWRDPNARLLLCLAAVPHTVTAYEELPLFLLPTTAMQGMILAVGSHLANLVQGISAASTHYNAERVHAAFLVFVYWPALFFVMRRPSARITKPTALGPI